MGLNVSKLSHVLLEGDQHGAWECISKEMASGADSLYIYESVITAAMVEIGKMWENNKITVADEHLATSTCDFLLSQYYWKITKSKEISSKNKKAMFLCLENEQHFLGLKMVAQLFGEADWETRLLGPNLPLEYAVKAASEWKPEVIGISFSILYHAENLSEYIETLERLPSRPVVLVGGRLISTYPFHANGSKKTVMLNCLSETKAWMENYSFGVSNSVGY